MVKPSKPSAKALGKRKAPPAGAKKGKQPAQQEVQPNGRPKRRPDQPKKVALRDQKFIPVPQSSFAGPSGSGTLSGSDDEDGMELDDEEEEGLDVRDAADFARHVDTQALGRTIKETKRLHEQSKAKEPLPKQKRQKAKIPLPEDDDISDYAFDSDAGGLTSNDDLDDGDLSTLDEDEDAGGSELSGEDEELNGAYDEDNGDTEDETEEDEEDEVENEDPRERRKRKKHDAAEADYETAGRARWTAPPKGNDEEEAEHVDVGRLPIKLPTGEVQQREGTTRIALPASKKRRPPPPDSEEEEEVSEAEDSDAEVQAQRLAGKKGRFGRRGIAEIIAAPGKNVDKLAMAKEQIAAVSAEILAGGELVDIASTLTRLSTFALPTVPHPEDETAKLPNLASIRGLAFLSQLAVYKDLVPGYRIRDLTAAEEAEKVREEIRRLREGEKMLVRSYKAYLKMLEAEIKTKSPLAGLSIRCMCDLLSSIPHFNFSENIMGVLVGRIARRTWDDDCALVASTFVTVFRTDNTALHSQTLVRLIARMVKERKFQVHANVLAPILHLRLKTELDKMREGKSKDRGKKGDPKLAPKYKSAERKKWATKAQKKKDKEMKEVEKEMAEAAAEVDQEERAQVQTETLKNLFVLYFSILKNPVRSPLLPAALEGISQFAHLINIDFFRDLLAVLRTIIADDPVNGQKQDETSTDDAAPAPNASEAIRTRLLAIVTAFELLSGQGEALNIDLGAFVNALFALLHPLSLDTGLEDPPSNPHGPSHAASGKPKARNPTTASVHSLSASDLLFRCLDSIFFSRHSSNPSFRSLAFAKRLAECALVLPPKSAKQALGVIRQLMARDAKVEALLDTEERMLDGVYKAEMDDPQLANAGCTSLWELEVLAKRHLDKGVRDEAAKLIKGSTE